MLNVETMLYTFNQIRKFYANALHERIADYAFSPNEISILILLSNNHTITTNSALCLVLGVSKGLVSRSMDALLKKGLVECSMDKGDKRIQHFHLSEKAEPIIAHIKEEVKKINEEVLDGVPEQDIRHMEETMIHILYRFKEKERNTQ